MSGGDADEKRIARAIVTGYQAAQHTLETSGSADVALKHLLHVANTTPEYRGSVDFEDVWVAADSFHAALQTRANRSPATYQRLVDLDGHIRSGIGLAGPSKAKIDHSGGDDASYAKAAIPPAFDALAIHVRDALSALEQTDSHDQAGRLRIVERIAGEIGFESHYILTLVGQVAKRERQSMSAAAIGSTLVIGRLLRWVRTRPAHEQLEAKLLRGIRGLDLVLTSLDAETIGQRDEVPLTENQRHGAEEEQADFDQALGNAQDAIAAISKLQKNKITLFQNLAGLEEQQQPDFKSALLNALIDTTLSTMLGQFVKALTSAPAAVDLPLAAKAVSLPAPRKDPSNVVGIDSVFNIGTGSLKTAITAKLSAAPGGIDPSKRALHYFCDGLRVAEDERLQAYSRNLNTLRQRSAITIDQLIDIEQLARSQKETIVEHQVQEITKGWAQYLARSRLGARTTGHDKVTKMGDYFGEHRPGGRVFGTNNAGTSGILSVTMLVDGGKPTLDPSATKVLGLNSELQSSLLTAADNDLDRIELPKEVHVESRFARATIALDEKNRVRDVLNWEEVHRYVGMSAAMFWRTWGHGLKVR